MKPRKCGFSLTLIFTLTIFSSLISSSAHAQITGECVNCHTMHNSQGGSSMATFGGETGPNFFLTRGSCIGCHAQGGTSKIVTIGGSQIPQVSHTESTDLAGGNFGYIGTGGDNRGHNVIDLFGANSDSTLNGPPGSIKQSYHDELIVNDSNLTCAGENGCHGNRVIDQGSGLPALKGAHHGNEDDQLNIADSVSNSYRFLLGVKGFENPTDKWQNVDANSHNEYYGATTPPALGCGGGETNCHGGSGIVSPNNTISGFCGTCHGNFHGLTGGSGGGTSDGIGIGGDAFSPFKRHPSDIVIKNSGEYAAYTTYSVEAPVGRTTVPDVASGTVVPGTDVVMCLSCHAAHATKYPDLLRWDYDDMIAGGGSEDTGCFTCHTQKNDE